MKPNYQPKPQIARYNLSLAEIRAYSYREMEKEIPKLTADLADLIIVCAMETLTLEFGFGSKRLKQFSDRFTGILECRAEGFVSLEEIKEELTKQYGVRV